MADWDENSRRLHANLTGVAERLGRGAHVREAPTTDLALRWHEDMLAGLDTPDPDYVARLRGVPPLDRIEVRVGDCWGTPAAEVPAAIERFLARLSRALRILDDILPLGSTPSSVDELNAVLTVCARAHAEWVAIHPFANGNGRIARIWANWVALRYGLPAFVRLRPRPTGTLYAEAARSAICEGDLDATIPVFRSLLVAWLNDHA